MQEQVGIGIPIFFSVCRATTAVVAVVWTSAFVDSFSGLWQESDNAGYFHFHQQRFPAFPRQLELLM